MKSWASFSLVWKMLTTTLLTVTFASEAQQAESSVGNRASREIDLQKKSSSHSVIPRDPVEFYDRGFRDLSPSESIIDWGQGASNIVHYIWCGKSADFTFAHFISVTSVLKIQRPSLVIFHYWHLPQTDPSAYNLWFQELRENYANFVLRQFNPKADSYYAMPSDCSNNSEIISIAVGLIEKQLYLGAALVGGQGGIYMDSLTALIQPLHTHQKEKLFISRFTEHNSSRVSVAVMSKGITREEVLQMSKQSTANQCLPHELLKAVTTNEANLNCFRFADTSLLPKDIFTAQDFFSRHVRSVFYGSPEPKVPRHSLSDAAPNVGHYVFFSGHEITFLSYLSILSALYAGKLDSVYIHTNKELKGPYWNKISTETRLHVVSLKPQTNAMGNPMRDVFQQADFQRFQILLEYGGVGLSQGSLMLKPIGDLRGYDFVVSYHYGYGNHFHPYPNVIYPGVFVSKPGSFVLKKILRAYKHYHDQDDSCYSTCQMPYKIYEKYPEHMKIEPKLQIMCTIGNLCHATWVPGSDWENHLSGSPFEWRQEGYVIHWEDGGPPEYRNTEALEQSYTMYADVARYVLASADRL